MKQILINVEPYEKRVAIIHGNVLEEFRIERTGQLRLAGNIYKGIIDSVVPGIGALFVNIGTGKNGFLYIDDVEEKSFHSLLGEEIEFEKKTPRERLKKGQEILVQVVKEPIGTKGPLLTTDISLPGKYVVLMPFNKTVGISKRIEKREERMRLKSVLETLFIKRGLGCIARTESTGVSSRHLALESKYLMNLWGRVQKRATHQKTPSVIYEEYDLPLRVIRDYLAEDVSKILVDSKEEYKKIARFANIIHPSLKKKIFFYRDQVPLYEKFNIEDQIEKVFRRKILLKSGGSIVIEQTEGLVAIDVNTGRYTGKKNPEETVFKTNMEASQEIAKQIMLRDVGGIIVIDFIDMHEKVHRRNVYDSLSEAFKRDKAKIKIFAISSIGLIEMTRQRVRKSLESVSFRECPYCNGMGRVKTPATIAIGCMRRLERSLREKKRTRQIFIVIHPDVADHMETSFKNVISTLERKFRKKISIKADPKLHVEEVYFE
ncbi:MAG: Rne/Rng family ribonuclease [Candidatus Omnitrophota bacterium]